MRGRLVPEAVSLNGKQAKPLMLQQCAAQHSPRRGNMDGRSTEFGEPIPYARTADDADINLHRRNYSVANGGGHCKVSINRMNDSVFFKRYYLGCLAQASYMIGDGGEAVLVDPQRDVDHYLADAQAAGYRIVGVIETHLHADFVSGHLELAQKTGATIYVSHLAKAEYPHSPVKDGDVVELGRLKLTILETPGHTPESISIVANFEGRDIYLFSGDTLFIGEIGRPDLVGWRGHSREEMAHDMFRSLRDKILKLEDPVEIWPAHGAGSTCGKAISDEPSAPLGRERKTNWGLKLVQAGEEERFVQALTEGLPTIPPYFPHDVVTNRRGAAALEHAVASARPISPGQFAELMNDEVLAVDVRDEMDFAAGHVAGSVSVPLAGNFAPWLGAVVPSGKRYVVVAPVDGESEALTRMARIGYDTVEGWLAGGMDAWVQAGLPVERLKETTAEEALAGDTIVLDVRSLGEFADGHLPNSVNIPLLDLPNRLLEVPKVPVAVLCHSGYRSSIACSILLRNGFNGVSLLTGGWMAVEEALSNGAPA